MLGRAPAAARLLGLAALGGASLVLSGGAGAEEERRLAPVRLVGSIEVRASLAAGSSTLSYSASTQIDVTVDLGKQVSIPLPDSWTGTRGSCRWDGPSSVGELAIAYDGMSGGRPSVGITGTGGRATTECEGMPWLAEPTWSLNPQANGAVEPEFTFFDIQSARGTGTYSLSCKSCGGSSKGYRVKAVWRISVEFTPDEPVAGRPVRMREGVILLDKRGTDPFWSVVRSRNVTARCDVYYQRPGKRQRKVKVRGSWRPPTAEESEGDVTCRWRIPRSARRSVLGVTPYLTYRGKTRTPLRGRPRGLFRRTL